MLQPNNDSFFLHRHVFDELLERKRYFNRPFSSIAMLGYSPENSDVNDDEVLPFELQSLDCIISTMQLHHMNDLPGVLRQIVCSLEPDGLFLAGFVGGNSLREVRLCLEQAELDVCGGVTPRVSPMIAVKDAGSLLQRAGFALPVVDVEKLEVLYHMPEAIFNDLRRSGEASSLYATSKPMTRRLYERACKLLTENYITNEGHVKVTVEIIYMMGWAPHISQQRALKPGSAMMQLEEALNL